MNTTVFLIRHGEIDNPKQIFYGSQIPMELNKLGREQIKLVSEKIKSHGFNIQKIYSSPLSRAKDSSQIFSSVFGNVPIEYDNDLRDCDIPAIAGQPILSMIPVYEMGSDEYSGEYVKRGNETKEQITQRMKRAFDKAVSENTGKCVAIVSHGDPIWFLLHNLLSPQVPIPLPSVFRHQDYPEKGSAVRIIVSGNFEIMSKEVVV